MDKGIAVPFWDSFRKQFAEAEKDIMTENLNDIINEENAAAEAAKRRAEKIKAIRASLHSDEPREALKEATEAVADAAPEEELRTETAEAPAETIDTAEADTAAEVPDVPEQEAPAEPTAPAEEDFAAKFRRVRQSRLAAQTTTAVHEGETAETSDAPAVSDQPQAEKPQLAPLRPRANAAPAAAAGESSPVPAAPVRKKKKKRKKPKTLGQRLRGLFPEKGDKPLEVVRKFVFLGSLVAIVVCGYMVGDYYLDLWRSRMEYSGIDDIYRTYTPIITTVKEDEPADDKYYDLLPGAKKLLDINSEVVGYITIPTIDGDPIVALPVVQAKDNSKYLDVNFKGENSRSGAIFLDWRNSFDRVENHRLVQKNSDNLVVYGHNMADESMFGSLKYYRRNENYYENHPIIEFNSNYEQYTYKIFSFFILDAEDSSETAYDCWNRLDFDTEEAFYDFVNEAKKRTLRTNDVDVKYGDPILTLSTCNTDIIGNDRGRLILMARRVRPGEDLYEGTKNSKANSNIKWPSVYYDQKPNEKYDPNAPFVPYGPAKKDSKANIEE